MADGPESENDKRRNSAERIVKQFFGGFEYLPDRTPGKAEIIEMLVKAVSRQLEVPPQLESIQPTEILMTLRNAQMSMKLALQGEGDIVMLNYGVQGLIYCATVEFMAFDNVYHTENFLEGYAKAGKDPLAKAIAGNMKSENTKNILLAAITCDVAVDSRILASFMKQLSVYAKSLKKVEMPIFSIEKRNQAQEKIKR